MERPARRMRPLLLLTCLTSFVAAAAALAACGEQPTGVAHPAASAAPPAMADLPANNASSAAARPAPADAGPYDGPRIGALFLSTPVMSDMEWPNREGKEKRGRGEGDREIKSEVVGYIRHGGKVAVIPEPHRKPNCQDGWYELLAGGFVCGKYASLDMNHPRLRVAPHAPDLSGPLPYQYGVNLTNGTPLYRTVPSREERLKLEPWLTKKPKPKPAEDLSSNPYLTDGELDAGVAAPTPMASASSDPFGLLNGEDGGIPWYLRDYDGGKPMVTLDDLKGDGPVARRMVKGFYLALDQERSYHNVKWWRTTGGLLAPFDRVYVAKPATDYRGVWVHADSPLPQSGTASSDGGARDAAADVSPLPRKAVQDHAAFGFVLWSHAKKYSIGADRKKALPGEGVPRFTIVRLTGESTNIGGYPFEETDEGWWMRMNEGTRTKPGPAPSDLRPGEKWVDVNLTTQTLVAYEGDKPAYVTVVSTGKRNLQIKEKDHPTPKGTFRIREKHIAATMDGDVATDGPYSIEDVPWIMYFTGSYALHGAFWHSNFGHTQSHGCVNLSPEDARALFGWTEPQLPEGWHGVVSTDQKPGTRVVVHD